jgi:hypothetical protein
MASCVKVRETADPFAPVLPCDHQAVLASDAVSVADTISPYDSWVVASPSMVDLVREPTDSFASVLRCDQQADLATDAVSLADAVIPCDPLVVASPSTADPFASVLPPDQ